MSDDRVAPIQPDPFPLSEHPTIRIEALQRRCSELESKLEQSEKDGDTLHKAFVAADTRRAELESRLHSVESELRGTVAELTMKLDAATSRLNKVLALVADLSVSDCSTCHEVQALFGAVVEIPNPSTERTMRAMAGITAAVRERQTSDCAGCQDRNDGKPFSWNRPHICADYGDEGE